MQNLLHMNTESGPSILILALEPDAAAQVSYRAHSVGLVPFAPRDEESALAASFRLRPQFILVQVGRSELNDTSAESIATAIGATLIVFGDETPELHRIAEAHGGTTVAINASRREFGAALQRAAGA